MLFRAGFYGSIAVMLACVVAGICYYFGWFRAAFSRGECCRGGASCRCGGKGEHAGASCGCGNADYLPVRLCSRVTLVVFCAALVLGSLAYWLVLRVY